MDQMIKNVILNYIKNNVIAKGLKLQAMTTNKTSGIIQYKGIRKYFYTTYNKDFTFKDIVIERA